MSKKISKNNTRSKVIVIILGILLFFVVLFALILPIALRPRIYSLSPFQIAQSDILAPYTLEYISEIQTNNARAAAEQQIELIYSPVPSVRKTQLILLQSILDEITSIKNNGTSIFSEKSKSLNAIPEIALTSEQVFQINNMTNEKWSSIKEETIRVLSFVLSEPITGTQVLERINNLPIDYLKFSETDNSLIVSLVKPFVVETYFYNSEETNRQRQLAKDSIEDIKVIKKQGEILVRKGQQITPEILESLEAFKLVGENTQWQDVIASASLTALVTIIVGLFSAYFRNTLIERKFLNSIVIVIFLLFLYLARFIIPNRAIVPYLFPIPAFGLIAATIYSPMVGVVLSLILSLLVGFNISSGIEISFFYFLCSLGGILSLGKGKRVADYFMAGTIIGIIGSLIIVSFRLPNPLNDWLGLLTLAGASLICGLTSSSIALLLQFLLSHLFGLTTPLRLMDLSRSDHPLLQFILRNAPGTYQHSLLVASMTEKAVSDIGGNSLLASVGALYHDSGKALNPGFFIENQYPTKENPHDKLTPEKSANVIIKHVQDGYSLARKHHLPKRIIDFILEHHGTLLTRYQLSRAVNEIKQKNRKIDHDKFRYPGPTPKSVETAVLMLADQSEARVRAEMPIDEKQIKRIIENVIQYAQDEGQLLNTDLTLKQLSQIKDSFSNFLQNTYHPRLRYPDDEMPKEFSQGS